MISGTDPRFSAKTVLVSRTLTILFIIFILSLTENAVAPFYDEPVTILQGQVIKLDFQRNANRLIIFIENH